MRPVLLHDKYKMNMNKKTIITILLALVDGK